jgi:hypothetical protein
VISTVVGASTGVVGGNEGAGDAVAIGTGDAVGSITESICSWTFSSSGEASGTFDASRDRAVCTSPRSTVTSTDTSTTSISRLSMTAPRM